MHLGHLVDTSSVQVSDLPAAIQQSLKKGVVVDSEQAALDTVESYRDQIDMDKTDAAITADKAKAKSDSDQGASDSSQSDDASTSGGE